MPWINDKYDYDTFDIQHANKKLNDYDKDLLDYDYYWYKNKYDKTKFKLIQRKNYWLIFLENFLMYLYVIIYSLKKGFNIMPWINDKYDYDTFDIQHGNEKLNDYDKDLLDYDYYWYKNKYDKTKFKLIQRKHY